MITDEEYNNAIQMLRSHYDGENEALRITSSDLEKWGFEKGFWDTIFPKLRDEGFVIAIRDRGAINQELYYQLNTRGAKLQSEISVLRKTENRYYPSPLLPEKLAKMAELEKEILSLERRFVFIVDGKKLGPYKKPQENISVSERGGRDKTGTRQKNKLNFFPDSGDIEFSGETGRVKNGTKGHALLALLNRNMNTPFTLKDICEKCNPSVSKMAHKFKKDKDVNDTVDYIRFKLKVNRGAFFPILKTEFSSKKAWKLIDK